MAQAPVLPAGFELPLEPRLPRIGSIDAVSLEERAASLAKRSIKKESKLFALDLAIRCIDLTTLEGSDTPGKAAAICSFNAWAATLGLTRIELRTLTTPRRPCMARSARSR